MNLFYRQYGEAGEPLIILHGLFGNQANWAWHARQFADTYRVYVPDARNHGRSPWSEEISYRLMAEDVLAFMDAQKMSQAHVIGHSMGGKTALQMAFLAPARVTKLVVVDIAPVAYPEVDFAALSGLLNIDLASLRSRLDADEMLAGHIREKAVRDFLLTNLQRDDKGRYQWRLNLAVLAQEFPALRDRPEPVHAYQGDILFIKGANSNYILPQHRDEILALLPQAEIKVIDNAGHWLHSEKPQVFIKIVRDFLAR
ncbi:MAG: alpha/beta fold hydrolase [Pseudomonadales bacterium]|nr:alpha/beta fold hydrolase [Pseudomonadales bacterium]